MINFSLEQYKNQLVDITNNCNLPIGVAYYVFKDVFKELEMAYYNSLSNEPKLTSEVEAVNNVMRDDDININKDQLEIKEEE